MADRIPGLPHVKMEKPTDYFRRLNETMKENPMDGYIPVWDGELYLEFHRGTYTSQGYNKKMNRRMEYRLRNVEMEAMLAQVIKGVPYDYERILKAWKIVLCHQFHDILPGSSIKEVYEDSHVEYGRAIALLEEVCEAVEAALYEPKEGVYTVFNNSNWARSGEAWIPMSEDEVRTTRRHAFLERRGRRSQVGMGKRRCPNLDQRDPLLCFCLLPCGSRSAGNRERDHRDLFHRDPLLSDCLE